MNPIEKFVDWYSRFVSRKLLLMAIIVILITGIAIYYSGTVTTKNVDYKDMLPEDRETIYALNVISDNLGGSDFSMIAIEIDSKYINSTESRDIRDPEILEYIDKLTKFSEKIEDVESVSSPTTIIRLGNNGNLLKSKTEINNFILNNPQMSQYISKDYQMALIKLRLRDNYDDKTILQEMESTINQLPKKEGITISPAGQALENAVVDKQIGPDISKTSQFSMIGIILILLLLFRSIIFGLTPLSTIVIGIVWAFGFIGLMGIGISSITSGVISMIMGVGIDFGIQIVNRFKQELNTITDEAKAMEITLNNVIVPMGTTTIAALIGFTAMSMGELSIMKDLGNMLTYGIVACFFAAITIVPVLLILVVKISRKTKEKIKEGKI